MKTVNITSALKNPMAIAIGSLVPVVSINNEISELITKATKQTLGAGKTKSQIVDLLQAKGIKSFHLDLGNKSNKDLCDSIKGAIVLGFDLGAQALLSKETKVLSDLEKGTKRYLIQQIGSEFAYYRRALANREEKQIVGDTEKSTPVEMYFKELQSALDRLAKLENVDFDLVAHTATIKKLLSDK